MELEEAKKHIQSLSPEQRADFSKKLSAYQEGAGEKETPTLIDKVQAGYGSAIRQTGEISSYLEDQVKEHFASKYIDDARSEVAANPTDDPVQKLVNKEYIEGTKRRAEEIKGTSLRDYNLEKKVLQVTEYKDVWGTVHEESLPYLISHFSSYLIDESTLAPIPGIKVAAGMAKVAKPTAQGLAAATGSAATGAAIVGYDNAAFQLYQKGKIDADELAMWSAGGAAVIPLITLGGKALSGWIKSRIDSGTVLTPEEVKTSLGKYLVGDPAIKQDAHVEQFLINYRNNADAIVPKLTDKLNVMIKGPKYNTLGEFLDNTMVNKSTVSIFENAKGGIVKKRVADKSGHAKRSAQIRAAQFEDPHAAARTAAESILAREELEIRQARTAVIGHNKAKEMDKAWKARRSELDVIKSMETAAYRQIEELDKQATKLLSKYQKGHVRPAHHVDEMDSYLEKQIDDVREQVDALVGKTKVPAKELQDRLNYMNEGGWASNLLLQHMASAGAGGVIGGALTGDKEGFTLGFMGGLAGSVAIVKMIPKADNLLDAARRMTADDTIMSNSLSRYVQRPVTMLNSMGPWGRKFATKLEMADIDTNMLVGKANELFSSIYKPVKDLNLGREFVRVMQSVQQASTPEVQKAVDGVRNDIFRQIVKSANRYGVLDKSAEKKLLADKSYWPRVYNQMFLNSKEGMDLWVKKFSKIGLKDKEALGNMVESISGKSMSKEEKFKKLMKNPKTGKYMISPEFARELYRLRSKDSISLRSTHLEHKRKIRLPEADFLNEFMVQDPEKVMMAYTHDVYKRIAYAKQFGAKDEEATKFLQHLVDNGKKQEHEYAKDLYYAAVGSENSAITRAQTGIGDTEKNVLGSVNAFETLKLTAAQVLNTTQATVNGLTFASKHGGVRALKSYVKGLRATFTKEGQKYAARTGAAVETTFMQLIAEANTHATVTSAFGKAEFSGGLSFLNRITNPSKFLDTIQFIRIEKFQRQLAANMGRAFMDDIVESRAKLMLQPITKSNKKKIDGFNKALKELNVDPNLTTNQLRNSSHLWEVAGQTFSNRVNHVNSMDRLPPDWRRPYARMFLKFKSFAFHQGAFINDNVVKPALEGNFKPLVGYLGAGGLGMGPDEIRRRIRSDDSKLTGMQRYLRSLTAIGGAGIIWDGAINFATNPSAGSAWSFIGGPAMGDAHKLTTNAYESFKNTDPRQLSKSVFSTIGGSYPFKKDIEKTIAGTN